MQRIGFGLVLLLGCLCFLAEPQTSSAQKKKAKGAQPVYVELKTKFQVHFKTWLNVLERSELTKLYDGKTPNMVVTMFAPNEDAFKEVKQDDLNELYGNKPKLIKFILAHTIEHEIWDLDELEKKGKLWNSLLQPLEIKKDEKEGALKLNNVKFALPDIGASNGVIHGIDGFLMPIQ